MKNIKEKSIIISKIKTSVKIHDYYNSNITYINTKNLSNSKKYYTCKANNLTKLDYKKLIHNYYYQISINSLTIQM